MDVDNGEVECLMCDVEGEHIVVPTSAMKQIITLEVSPPPPSAMGFVAGLGLVEGDVVVAVSLSAVAATATRAVNGLLFVSADGLLRFVVVVTRVLSVARVRLVPHASRPLVRAGRCPPSWFGEALTAGREPLCALQVAGVFASLKQAA